MSSSVLGVIVWLCTVHSISNINRLVVAFDVLPPEKSESDGDSSSFEQPKIWSTLLEELALNPSSVRESRVLQMPHHKYIPTSNVYINKRIGMVEPTGSTAFKQNIHFNDNGSGGNTFNNRVTQSVPNEVSETDLYLLSAIEKLVYRVDYMERRLRKTEQVVYYLMAGNNQNQKEIYEKPCPMNFTRVGDNCYLFVVDQGGVNWKTANNICRSYGAHLAELETLSENNDIAAYLINQYKAFNGFYNFWLGGLNPGLLWIWSSSARPVNPNVNISMIQNATNTSSSSPITMKINNSPNKNRSNATSTTTTTTHKPTSTSNDKNVNNNKNNKKEMMDIEIEGNGRCLGLAYKSDKHIYKLHGLECTSRQKFVCELPQERSINNEIDRIAKKLFE